MQNRSSKFFLSYSEDRTSLIPNETSISKSYGSINQVLNHNWQLEKLKPRSEAVKQQSNSNPPEQGCSSFQALFFAATSSFCLGACSVLVKKMVSMDTGVLSMVRNLGTLVGSIPMVAYCWTNPFGPSGKQRYLLLLRCVIGGLAMYLLLLTFRLLPLTIASIIIASLPALVTIGAKIFLKEPIGIAQSFAILLCFSAVLLNVGLPDLIMKNSKASAAPNPVGIAIAIATTFMFAFCLISMRMMKDIHSSVILLNMSAIGALENGLLTVFLGHYSLPQCNTMWERWGLLGMGCFGFLGQLFMTIAAQSEAIGMVSIVKTSSDVLVSIIFQIAFFEIIPNLYNIIGATLIILCISIIGLRKWIISMQPNSIIHHKLKFLLA